MNVRQALNEGTRTLRVHRCDGADATLESEALLAHVLGVSREKLFMLFDEPLSAANRRRFAAVAARRAAHEPLGWILGSAWFMGREFEVNRHTLIPRPATEHVVEAAVSAARSADVREAVDVGTGSACIAVSLALALPAARIFATDISMPALAAARRNARRHGVAGRMTVRKTNLIGHAPATGRASDRPLPLSPDGTALFVANLPYLPAGMRKTLSTCVRSEPSSALFSGKDGLDASRALAAQLRTLADAHPNKKMIVAFEILPGQFSPLASHLRNMFRSAKSERIKNHQGTTVGLIAKP